MPNTHVSQNISAFVDSVVNGRQRAESAYAQAMADLYGGEYQRQRARNAATEGRLLDDRWQARVGLERNLQPFAPQAGLDTSALAGLLRTGDLNNPEQITGALGDLARQYQISQAVKAYGAGNVDMANFGLQAGGEDAYLPYTVQGDMLFNQATGAGGLTPLGGAKVSTERAQQGAYGAAAGASHASAAAARALENERNTASRRNQFMPLGNALIDLMGGGADPRVALTVPHYEVEGGVVLDPNSGNFTALPPEVRASSSLGAVSANAEKLAELRALYPQLPPDLLNGIAYGTLDWRQDPMGLSSLLINTLTGQVMGRIDARGQFTPEAGVYGGGVQMPGPPGGNNDPLGIR